MNIDQSELDKFEALASRWWDPESEFKPLHQINPLRANWIDELAPVAGLEVLDVGCGGGLLSEALSHRGAKMMGIDMGEKPLGVAQLHAQQSGLNIEYQRITAEELAEQHPERFDRVCCLEMLEHVPDPGSVVAACAKMTKPGGWLFFSTINRNPKSYLFAIIGAEYVLRLLPRGTHDWQKFIRPSELTGYCRQAGLEVKKIKGMTYNPITQIYKLVDKDVSVNYILAVQKPL